MNSVTQSELEAKVKQLVDAGADLSLHREYGYWVISNKSQSAGYLCSGTKAECARWLNGFAHSFYGGRHV